MESGRCRILDGRALAARRAGGIARRAEAVRARRGSAPRMLLVGFEDERGRVPHLTGKVRAAEEVGIDVVAMVIGAGTGTNEAVGAFRAALSADGFDGVFVQIPYPETVDGDAFSAAIPADLDVDVMSPARVSRYLSGADDPPPVTVAAALLLLDGYDVPVEGRRGLVVGEESEFTAMFREALERRGARMDSVLSPDVPELGSRMGEAELVVVTAGRPGGVRTEWLASGAVAIDVGYYNPGGRGDIDRSGGIAHLAALAPVPGGIGPMTVSALLERVVEFSESAMNHAVRAAGIGTGPAMGHALDS